MPRVHGQAAFAVLMVRPIDFDYNNQTAHDNVFQNLPSHDNKTALNEEAMFEFEICVEELRAEGVKVIILDEIAAQSHIKTPDAVFCNNWFSTHNNGLMVTYPMSTPNRREEVKKTPVVRNLFEKNGFLVTDVKVLHDGQNTNEYLESTGSMVFDHLHGVIYAARSIRTNHNMIMRFMDLFKGKYTECIEFDTKSSHGKPFYHTNVMMSIGQQYAVVCSEAIVEKDRSKVLNSLRKTGRDVIEITLDQAENYFCGNILQLRGERSKNFVIAMSESCLRGFTREQRLKLRTYGKIVIFPVAKTIEFVGGGSARCMLGEIFLPRHDPDMYHSHDKREECKPHSVETD